MTSRRQFIRILPAPLLIGATSLASAQANPRIEESDPIAIALNYKHDASKVDKKKFPSYKEGQVCANCQLYQSAKKDPWAPCPAVANKQVNAKGWCSAWIKKA